MPHFRGIFSIALVCVVLAGLSACSSRGIAEFQLYSRAFDAQLVEGDRIFDLLAAGERTLANRRLSSSQIIAPFDPNQAAYYVDGVDPPLTASLRASLKSLKAYNEALSSLADGASAEALTNRLGILSANTSGALAALAAAAGGIPGVTGSTGLASSLSTAFTPLGAIFKEAATLAARETFRRQLIEAYPHMRRILAALREGTPTMFLVLERSRATRGAETPTGLTDGDLAGLAQERQVLAGWVLLIDQTLVAMEAAATAAAAPMSATDLAALSETAIELRVLAEKVKGLSLR